MLLRFFSFLISFSFAALAQAERRLPANVQADLLFPRHNETYVPTQRFPIVIGFQNLDAVSPFEIRLRLDVYSLSAWKDGDPALWQDVPLGISDDVFLDKVGPSPPKQFLYYPTINMTNGTTDRFEIRWGITIKKRCFGNSSMEDGGDGWSSGIDNYSVRHIVFNTAPGGQFPDVAATLDACPEGGENTTATIRVTDISSTSYGRYQCPVFETDVQPARCAYRDVAQEIAANVSAD
ncbi:hypothetical protein CPLU01_15893, partial [Colletotrichum plurivorum]